MDHQRIYRHNSFREFIESEPRSGCGYDPDQIEKLIAGDEDAERMFRQAVTLSAGRPSKNDDNIINKERVTGTSRAYTLDRLSRESPGLYEAVCRKEMSANAAAIQAGFRKPPKPLETIRKLLPKLTPEERQQLKDML